jgi:hypothetical protein
MVLEGKDNVGMKRSMRMGENVEGGIARVYKRFFNALVGVIVAP